MCLEERDWLKSSRIDLKRSVAAEQNSFARYTVAGLFTSEAIHILEEGGTEAGSRLVGLRLLPVKQMAGFTGATVNEINPSSLVRNSRLNYLR